jgi:hypothetical protein
MVGMAVEVGVAVGATVGVSVGVGVGECVGAAADELHPAVVSASSNAPVASKRHLMIETPPRKSGRRPNRGERQVTAGLRGGNASSPAVETPARGSNSALRRPIDQLGNRVPALALPLSGE